MNGRGSRTGPESATEFRNRFLIGRYRLHFEDSTFDDVLLFVLRRGSVGQRLQLAAGGMVTVVAAPVLVVLVLRLLDVIGISGAWALAIVVLSVVGTVLLLLIATLRAPISRARRNLLKNRSCHNCVYSLIGVPTGEDGFGVCPECGQPFHISQYMAPDRMRPVN